MELPRHHRETWHGFDILGYVGTSEELCSKYHCIVRREGDHLFKFVGHLTLADALRSSPEEQPDYTLKELALKRVRAIIDLRTFEPGETIERSLRVPPESQAREISDRVLRRKLLEVLHTIQREHPRSYKREQVDRSGLCMELGISDEQYCFAVNYLCGNDLIKRFGDDPEEYSRVFITIEGVDAYEQGRLVGPVMEELVAETRSIVDSKIERLCPKAADKLAQTYADLIEGHTELKWSKVAYACRQILEDFTDAICDPEFLGEEIERPAKSRTKNKIQAALKARIPKVGKTERELLEALAGHIDDYFDKLNDYIQKQVHPGRRAQVEAESAKRCLIYTYLLIADVLSLLS